MAIYDGYTMIAGNGSSETCRFSENAISGIVNNNNQEISAIVESVVSSYMHSGMTQTYIDPLSIVVDLFPMGSYEYQFTAQKDGEFFVELTGDTTSESRWDFLYSSGLRINDKDIPLALCDVFSDVRCGDSTGYHQKYRYVIKFKFKKDDFVKFKLNDIKIYYKDTDAKVGYAYYR